ncbi:VOC family protein [Pseudonocardia sediminis]|nr:VOC family protein [Pseudonocardia sediminis]
MSTRIATFALFALDCPDPLALARFYSAITGWPIAPQDDGHWAQLDTGGAGATLAFQRVDDFRPPRWPGQEHPQQAHPDFDVPDLDVGERALLDLGARKHEVQPRPESFRVYLDPVGHPFCLVRA